MTRSGLRRCRRAAAVLLGLLLLAGCADTQVDGSGNGGSRAGAITFGLPF
jgi:hypothetical protein